VGEEVVGEFVGEFVGKLVGSSVGVFVGDDVGALVAGVSVVAFATARTDAHIKSNAVCFTILEENVFFLLIVLYLVS